MSEERDFDCCSPARPASPLPEGRADGREGAWEEGFKAGGRWSLLDEEWFEDSQDFDEGDLPPRPPKPANPYVQPATEVHGYCVCDGSLRRPDCGIKAHRDAATIRPVVAVPEAGEREEQP